MELDAFNAALAKTAAKIPTLATPLPEPQTKSFLVLPIIRALGYDDTDPSEVVPVYSVDVGEKRSEKVDYAILKEGKPVILVECEPLDAPLRWGRAYVLSRCFNSLPSVRFGVLTNGSHYQFYTDRAKKNTMDHEPFFTFSLGYLDADSVATLHKFSKEIYDPEAICGRRWLTAEAVQKLRTWLGEELRHPSDAFLGFAAEQALACDLPEEETAEFRKLMIRVLQEFNGGAVDEPPVPDPDNPDGHRGQYSFFKYDIPKGAVLVLDKHPKITATVADEWHLEYEGVLYSTSRLVAKLLGLKAAQGPRYWLYKGRTLFEIRESFERATLDGSPMRPPAPPAPVSPVPPEAIVYERTVSYKDDYGRVRSGIARCRKEGENRFVVVAGSFISPRATGVGVSPEVRRLRATVRIDARGYLLKDYVFAAISPAASFVAGTSQSGEFWTGRQR